MSLISLAAIAVIIYVVYRISENESEKKESARRRNAAELRRQEQIRNEIDDAYFKAMDDTHWMGR